MKTYSYFFRGPSATQEALVKLALPEIEGKYEVLEKFREGGMGAIYKVRHRLLGELRVIKVIRPQLEDDAELKARFLREARMGIKLRHPNIAQLYDFTLDEVGNAYMVMEYIDGFTLQGILKRLGPLPVSLMLEVSRQALRSLGYLHQQGFVHRDISPDNLMLTRDVDGEPLVKLIDLGIAKGLQGGAEARLTATGMFLGKIRYAAPEQFQSSDEMDGRADLYSYGIVFYELLTGRYPISGTTPPAIIAGHLFGEPMAFTESDPEGRLSPELREVIQRCLEKKPEDRFADARELGDRLEALQRSCPLERFELHRLVALLRGDRAGDVGKAAGDSTAKRLRKQFPPEPTPAPTRVEQEEETGTRDDLGSQVRALLHKAETLAEKEHLAEARKALETARILAPDDPQVSARFDELETRYQRQLEESAQRMRQVTNLAGQVQKLLRRGDLHRAREVLQQGREAYGEQDVLGSLERRLEELERQQQDIRRRSEEGRALLQAGELADAQSIVEHLRRIAPKDPTVERLAEELAVARGAEEVRQKLSAGELDAADEMLADAVKRHGEVSALRELGPLLQEARRKEHASGLAGRAEQLLVSGDLTGAADQLHLLQQIDPSFSGLAELLEKLAEGRRHEEIATRARRIEELLEQRETAGAREALLEALTACGEAAPFEALKGRLDQLLEEQEASRRQREIGRAAAAIEEELATDQLATAREHLESAEKSHGAEPFAPQRERLEARELEREEVARAEAAAAMAMEATVLTPRVAESPPASSPGPPPCSATTESVPAADDETPPAATAAELETVRSPPPSPSTPFMRRPLVLGGAVVGAVALIALLLVLGRGQDRPAVPSQPPLEETAPAAPAALETGTLILNALPWAEVIEISNEAGEAQPLPSPPSTPLSLELPPGEYRISLRHPSQATPRRIELEVEAGRTTRKVVPMAPAEVEELLEGLGW